MSIVSHVLYINEEVRHNVRYSACLLGDRAIKPGKLQRRYKEHKDTKQKRGEK
jgi:hypothetical protein